MTASLQFFSLSFNDCFVALKVFAFCWLAVFFKEFACQVCHFYRYEYARNLTQKKRNRDFVKPTVEKTPAITNEEKWILDDLMCPITLELPCDPVYGEDGRVYEKSAIELYFRKQRNRPIRSCYTNEPMGKRLLAAPQMKDRIQRLIENGAIAGPEAQAWLQKVAAKEARDELLAKALEGDVQAMEMAAYRYARGIHGFEKDKEMAGYWSKKAHAAGSVFGMGITGSFLANGEGCVKNEKEGLLYLALAAGEGSDWAACKLGLALARGKYGLEINQPEAIRLLRKAVGNECSHKNMTREAKRQAEDMLRVLEGDSSGRRQ